MLVIAAGAGACGRQRHDGISAERILQHLAALRADASATGLPAAARYDSATAYLVRVLERAGVAPGASDPEDRPRHLQPVPLIQNLVGDGTVLELRTDGGTKRIAEGRRSFLLVAPGGADPVVPTRSPVFVGYGLHAPEHGVDDLAGLDLSGRPVLMTATPPDSTTLTAMPEPVRRMYADPVEAQHRRMQDLVERGASAILLLPERWLPEGREAMSVMGRLSGEGGLEGERYPGHILESPVPIAILHADLVDRLFLGRPYHPTSHAGRHGSFELDDIGLGLEVDVRREPRVTANVVGVIPGTDPSLANEYVLLGARLDDLEHPGDLHGGAGDAVACAALLETAAALVRWPARRSVVVVFFVGEGAGVPDAAHLLAHPPVAPDSIVAAIHVGRVSRAERFRPGLRAMAWPSTLAREVQAAARGSGVEMRVASRGTASFRGTPAGVFLDAGIPSLLVTLAAAGATGANSQEARDAPGLVEAAGLLSRLVAEVADARSLGRLRAEDEDPPAGW